MRSIFTDPDKKEKVEVKHDKQMQGFIRHFTAQLRAAREKRGVTQKELAARCGTDQKTISTLERGGNFKMDTYARACRELGLEARVQLRLIGRGRPREED